MDNLKITGIIQLLRELFLNARLWFEGGVWRRKQGLKIE